ncbi:MAG: hypothetical protein ACJAV1_002825 [Paraglaciecola sp.]|jgi:hypothetical protein
MFVGYSYDSSRLACLISPIRFLWVWILNSYIICFAASSLLVVKAGLGFKAAFPQIFLEKI